MQSYTLRLLKCSILSGQVAATAVTDLSFAQTNPDLEPVF
jgi:hypothetical protein